MTRFLPWRPLPLAALVLGLAAVGAVPAAAQSSARIEGIVTDNTGAAVPGASVTATNTGTNAARTVTTDGEGSYTITPLAVGDYRLQAELSGFKPVATRLKLSVNRSSTPSRWRTCP